MKLYKNYKFVILLIILILGSIIFFRGKSPLLTTNGCDQNSKPSIKLISPNGGESLKIEESYTVKWNTCNVPENSWVALSYSIPSGVGNITYSQDCITQGIPATAGSYDWKISSNVFGCSDAGYTFPPNTDFQTKIKAKLYTGAPECVGLPSPDSPCLTEKRTLHAEDESDNYFNLRN